MVMEIGTERTNAQREIMKTRPWPTKSTIEKTVPACIVSTINFFLRVYFNAF